jgi:colanic acid biosynthesis glycosyl transferase WcaI
VRFLPLQPSERLGDLLAMADIHLLPQRRDAADLMMPSKLTGMFASGRPVVATAGSDTEIGRVVEGRGLVSPPESPGAFVEAIRTLAGDADLRASLGLAARRFSEENLAHEMVLSRFHSQLVNLASRC